MISAEKVAADLKLNPGDTAALTQYVAGFENNSLIDFKEQLEHLNGSSELVDPSNESHMLGRAMLVVTLSAIEDGPGDHSTKVSARAAGLRDLSSLTDATNDHATAERLRAEIEALKTAGVDDTDPRMVTLLQYQKDNFAHLKEVGENRIVVEDAIAATEVARSKDEREGLARDKTEFFDRARRAGKRLGVTDAELERQWSNHLTHIGQ